jgi:hypothetical protein
MGPANRQRRRGFRQSVRHSVVNSPSGDADLTYRWRVAANLLWTQFDDSDDWVVYDPASADIQQVTASARQLWVLASAPHPLSIAELADRLAAALGRGVDDELIAATKDTLAFMDRAGLVRPERI